ncbi:SRPBCC family protein [Aeromicrobium sp. Leaf350]|uniref:SRPBCC family protein n=1 Tax=Aeromicrobium sp. Leaf350 TaxID=2876565 RepID=UPI001E2D830D|nr:SRPBCC family protein [Aeromicrobium sp. Leaf350]
MLTLHREIPAHPDQVWHLLTDLAAWPLWGPTVRRAEIDGEFVAGATGRVWPPLGPPLPFELTTVVPGRRWSWKVAGVPATSHAVEASGAGTRLSMGTPVWAPAYAPVVALALRRIDRLARA